MALKRQYQVTAAFSMASMTDVIFLLLIFFMVTSTFVLPNALDVNLPESSEQTPIKPSVRIYIDAESRLYATFDREEPKEMLPDELTTFLTVAHEQAPENYVAVYADEIVPYGNLIKVLDLGAAVGVKMVLATVPAPDGVKPAAERAAKVPEGATEAPAQ